MITRILIPTDFSETSNNALEYGIQLAKKTGAEIHLLHSIDVPVTDAYVTARFYISYLDELEEQAGKELKKTEEKYGSKSGIKFHSAIRVGFVTEVIQSYSKEHKIDMIVMGTTGASGVTEVLFGSNTSQVISNLEIPVLAVPSGARYHDISKIVYATDFEEPEFPAFSRLIYLAKLYNAKLFVQHTKSGRKPLFKEEHNFFTRNREEISYPNWEMITNENANIIDGIDNFVKETKADLLVMAKHNRTFFQRIFHRSLNKKMACHVDVPLLILNKNEELPTPM